MLLHIAKGDAEAFTRLVAMYWERVFAHAMTYVQSYPVAEELTQDVFMKLWHNRDKLPAIESFLDYLFILSRNLLVSALRKKIAEPLPVEAMDAVEELLAPDRQMETKELYALILKGAETLPPQQQQVFKLGRIEGLSYDEIADKMQITKRTVRFHMVQALNTLRVYLKQHELKIFALLSCYLFF